MAPSFRDGVLALGFAVGLGVVKLVYAPLVLLLALVPAGGGRAAWRPWLTLSVAGTLVGAGSSAAWLLISNGGAAEVVVLGVTGRWEFDALWMVEDPGRAVLTLQRTVAEKWYAWLLNIAWPKFTRCTPAESIAVPVVWGTLLLAASLDGRVWRPTPMQRVVGAAVFVSVFLVAVMAALATGTPAEHDWAAGVHGRYFLPAFPAIAIAILPPLRPSTGQRNPVLWICLLAGAVAANALVLVAFARQYDWSGFVLGS